MFLTKMLFLKKKKKKRLLSLHFSVVLMLWLNSLHVAGNWLRATGISMLMLFSTLPGRKARNMTCVVASQITCS